MLACLPACPLHAVCPPVFPPYACMSAFLSTMCLHASPPASLSLMYVLPSRLFVHRMFAVLLMLSIRCFPVLQLASCPSYAWHACLYVCPPACPQYAANLSSYLTPPPRLLFTMTRLIYLSCMFKMSTCLSAHITGLRAWLHVSLLVCSALSVYLAVHLPCLFGRAEQGHCLPT
jgi:hypothetical protein